MNYRRLEVGCLRLIGAIECLAFGAVIMPRSWMEVTHEWLGMGTMPHGAVLDFMIRQGSFVYGLHGLFLWIISTDVVRYRPLIIFTGISYMVAAVVFAWIDEVTGMPLFWTVGDALGCFFWGAVLLWLDRWANSGK